MTRKRANSAAAYVSRTKCDSNVSQVDTSGEKTHSDRDRLKRGGPSFIRKAKIPPESTSSRPPRHEELDLIQQFMEEKSRQARAALK